MELNSKDNDVLQLLNKLKEANGTYPQELLAIRRQRYLKQVAQISAGAGLALALKSTAKAAGKGTAFSPVAGPLLETILVVAIVAEAGAVAYFYRDKLIELFQSITGSPRTEQVSNPPVISSPIPGLDFTVSPVVTETDTLTPVGTPSLIVGQPTTDGSSETGAQAVSTSQPSGKNGNQYGLTPLPVRTKDAGKTNTDTTQNTDKGGPDKKK